MPRRVTKANPAGVRPYDHTLFAPAIREHQAAAEALNELIFAMRRSDEHTGAKPQTQAEWLTAVADLAAAIPYADSCQRCPDDKTWLNVPLRAEIENGWLTGHYLCHNGHRWTCGWSVSSPAYW
ncbi:hypothetical protein ABZ422_09375 [Micromonospora zamorensis]|uniref:hypothetical protein n=1 Tax=Micromonospora zamorensis TaxID=709883 RepID=UPI0033CE0754